MEKFKTELEKTLWTMFYNTLTALAKEELESENDLLRASGCEDVWPALQKWDDLGGSSKAIFLERARESAGIDHDIYFKILRENTPETVK